MYVLLNLPSSLVCDPGRHKDKWESSLAEAGLGFYRRELRGKMMNGDEFACDLWTLTRGG